MILTRKYIATILAALIHFQSLAQSLVGNNLRLKPSAIPTVCNTGDLRVDSGDSNKLKICRSNTWTQFTDFTSLGTADTVLASNGTTASWTKVNNANVSDTAAIAYGKLNLTASVTNADVATNAAVAYSKLNLATSILNSDVSATAGIVYSKLNLTASVTGADVSTATSVTVASVRANAASSFGGNVTASGNFIGNLVGNVTGSVTGNADTATALAATPTACGANQYASAIAASGNLTCAQVGFSQLSGTASIAQGAMPPGGMMLWGTATCPSTFLLADGSAVSRTTYSALFAVYGTTYGTGDGTSTFNLPAPMGLFLSFSGTQTISSIAYSRTLNATQGDAMQGHFHSISNTYNLVAQGADAGTNAGRSNSGTVVTSPQTIGAATTDGTNGTPRTASETRPANIALNLCVKT